MPKNESAVKQISTSIEEKRVDVSVDGDKTVIRMSTYANGIGWFTQKTITIDAEMLDELHSQLSEARINIRRESDEILSADILDF